MADEKVNMGPEENKPPETLSPPGQGNLPPLEENNAPAVSGEDKAAPDHVEPDPPSADKHTQRTVLPGMGEDIQVYPFFNRRTGYAKFLGCLFACMPFQYILNNC